MKILISIILWMIRIAIIGTLLLALSTVAILVIVGDIPPIFLLFYILLAPIGIPILILAITGDLFKEDEKDKQNTKEN